MKMFSNKELRNMIITLFFEQLLVMLVGIVDTFVVAVGKQQFQEYHLSINLIQFLSIYLQHLLQEGPLLLVNILVIKIKKERFYHQVNC